MSWVLGTPADTGCPVTSSFVTCTGTGTTRSAPVVGILTSATVTLLDYGAIYTCSVVVSSGAGASSPSPPSESFTVEVGPKRGHDLDI